jgi:hypothetical protein
MTEKSVKENLMDGAADEPDRNVAALDTSDRLSEIGIPPTGVPAIPPRRREPNQDGYYP